MERHFTRRRFLKTSLVAGSAASVAGFGSKQAASDDSGGKRPLAIGLMTYRLGQEWDLDTIIANCKQTKWEHAELRTTHSDDTRTCSSRNPVRTTWGKRFNDLA